MVARISLTDLMAGRLVELYQKDDVLAEGCNSIDDYACLLLELALIDRHPGRPEITVAQD